MNIYIIRHGTTIWNKICRSQGRSQNRLSTDGKLLVQKSAEKLKNIPIDVIYSSPLMRTMQTANIVNQYHNLKIKKDDRLIEIDQGIFTGRFYKDLTEDEKQAKLEKRAGTKMESLEHVYERVKDFCDNVLKHETHKNILVISHNNVCSILERILKNEVIDFNNNEQMNSFQNAEIRKIII